MRGRKGVETKNQEIVTMETKGKQTNAEKCNKKVSVLVIV